MSKLHEHLHKDTFEWRMSANEKVMLRNVLEAHMEANPLGGMKSPYTWVSFVEARRLVLVPVLILLLGSGTAYAAQGALPGDALYPIKIHINEAVAGTLAVSDVAKASYNAQVAAERLKEAQALAAQNKLDATTTQELAANYDAHASLASTYADKVQSDDPAQGAELHASLASIQAEGDVLAAVAARDGSDETKQNADNLASRARGIIASAQTGPVVATLALAPQVRTFAAKVAPAAQVDAKIAATETSGDASDTGHEDDKNVQALRGQVMISFTALKSAVNRAQKTVDASTSAELDARFQALEDMVHTAKETNNFSDYQQALSAAAVLKTFIAAQLKFNGNILAPLLKLQIQTDNHDESALPHTEWRDNPQSVQQGTQNASSSVSSETSVDARHGETSSHNEGDGDGAASAPPTQGVVQDVIQTVQNGLHL